jgi:prepilin-type N-terminal cleavage/methylation domain-containing protein
MTRVKTARAAGFTLIELMIVVAIIGILSALAYPKFTSMVAKAKESTTLNHLGAIRSALSIYYSEGDAYPTNLRVGLTAEGKYLTDLPAVEIPAIFEEGNPGHMEYAPDPVEGPGLTSEPDTLAHWYYVDVGNEMGRVMVLCTHNNSHGIAWTTY